MMAPKAITTRYAGACIITDSARATGQVFALVLGGIR